MRSGPLQGFGAAWTAEGIGMNTALSDGDYPEWLEGMRRSLRNAQGRVALAANRAMILVYWEIGQGILQRQAEQGWGAQVIDRLARDLSSAFPQMRGFSTRNLKYMRAFAAAWPYPQIVQQLVAQLPWGHNVTLLDKVVPDLREWYAKAAVDGNWSRAVLLHQVETKLHERHAGATHNFPATMPPERASLAAQAFKDPYVLDFVDLAADAHERHLEAALIERIRQFLMELGNGFAFIGSQYRLEVGEEEFYLDLLFYHTKLHSHVVVDLKVGEFKPEHVGKMGFYLAAVDAQVATDQDAPSIGLILCRGKNGLVVEYALRDVRSPIAVSDYRVLPAPVRDVLPSPDAFRSIVDESRSRSLPATAADGPDTGAPPGQVPEVARELARAIESIAVSRKLDVPAGFADTLAIYADEADLRTMIANIDDLKNDLVEFVRDNGIDFPNHDV